MSINLTKTNSETFLNEILKKRISVDTFLSIISEMYKKKINRNDFEHQLLLHIENHIKTLESRNKNLGEHDLYSRNKPYIHKYTFYHEAILDFRDYYKKRYAQSTLDIHMRTLRQFLRFITERFSDMGPFMTLSEMKLNKQMINAFEESLVERLNLEEIQKCTVYKYLISMKLFLDMLLKQKLIRFSYVIPASLRDQGKRSNDYVGSDEIVALLEAIENSNSKWKVRDMCTILLVMELGCRPIEVKNILLDDLILTENLISLHCVKSGRRTLAISKDLTKMIKKYLDIRSTQNIDHQTLFVNHFGEPFSPTGITSMFLRKNKIAFGYNRFNAKALRHTYATNALDNLNDFDQVSESMGHKHRSSTEWYIHRSIQRMLSRSLPHNPLNRMNEV